MSSNRFNLLSISVISHGQLAMVMNLLNDIEKYCSSTLLEVLVTINIEEVDDINILQYSYPIKIIKNNIVKGFGANHNQAFVSASGSYFCVVNPDILFESNPFPILLSVMQDANIGVCAPMVVNADGVIEDSARTFPKPFSLLKRFIKNNRRLEYSFDQELVLPDWVGGMFMLFRTETFREINGFDERFFLYYEDVDICARLSYVRYVVVLCTASKVIHLAQRTSHKSLKYLRWHITSLLRYFITHSFRRRL